MNAIELSDYLRERGLPIPVAALGKPELHPAVRLAADRGVAWSRIDNIERALYVDACLPECPTCHSGRRGEPGVGWIASGCSHPWHFALADLEAPDDLEAS